MATFVLLLLFGIVGLLIWGYEKYQKASFIAKAIDGQAPSGKFITEQTQNVISMLKEPGKLRIERYINAIRLPDQQRISFQTDSMEMFKKYSNLNFEPTPMEWQILKGIVKNLYPNL